MHDHVSNLTSCHVTNKTILKLGIKPARGSQHMSQQSSITLRMLDELQRTRK